MKNPEMKPLLMFIALFVIVISCDQKSEKLAEAYKLPFGLEYYKSKDYVNHTLSNLVSKGLLDKYSDDTYDYKYMFNENEISLRITPVFHNDSLYKIDVRKELDHKTSFPEGESNKKQLKITKSLLKNLKIDLADYRELPKNIFNFPEWGHEDGSISLIGGKSFIIIFEDKIISDKLSKVRNREISKMAIERLENGPDAKVENSTWDGSVGQVKKYLDKNLIDKKSYESIEWYEVQKNETVYRVRHKYRAKNKIGVYTIEDQIFTLDINGNIINVINNN